MPKIQGAAKAQFAPLPSLDCDALPWLFEAGETPEDNSLGDNGSPGFKDG
jgi:hypothetical protein